MKSDNKTNSYKTLGIITLGFTLIFALTAAKWALWIAIILGVSGLFSTKLLNIIIYLWDKLTLILSKIVPNILLALLYYLFLTPVALLSRIFSKSDPLMLKNDSKTLFVDYKKDFSKSDFEKPW